MRIMTEAVDRVTGGSPQAQVGVTRQVQPTQTILVKNLPVAQAATFSSASLSNGSLQTSLPKSVSAVEYHDYMDADMDIHSPPPL